MGKLLSKFNKAVDAFADALTEDVSSTKSIALYKYIDLTTFVSKMKRKYPMVSMYRISMKAQNEFDGIIFPEKKYIIRVLLLEENGYPICIGEGHKAYLGSVTIASSVDKEMIDFMKGQAERTEQVRSEK